MEAHDGKPLLSRDRSINKWNGRFVMKKSGKIENISWVSNHDLCTGCGTCISLCPTNAICLSVDKEKGAYTPKVDELKCNHCGICLNICPGHEVDFNNMDHEIKEIRKDALLIGKYLQCYIGYSTNEEIRYNCTSGGLITQIIIDALENKIIDGALLTRMKRSNPLEPEAFIARTREDICSARGSKYCPVPVNVGLKEILNAPKGQKFAVVGLPCHIHGIKKAELLNKELRDKIIMHLGLFCSGPMTFNGIKFLIQKYNIREDCIASLEYRCEGWPGHMKVKYKNGDKKLVPREEYGFFQSFGFFVSSRCTLCCDQLNELADISFGDAWLPEINDCIGTSVVISRGTLGENLLHEATLKRSIAIRKINAERISHMGQKKALFLLERRIANLRGHKTPSFNIYLPKIYSIPRYLLLYSIFIVPIIQLNMAFSSNSYLGRYIEFLALFERKMIRYGKWLVDLKRLK